MMEAGQQMVEFHLQLEAEEKGFLSDSPPDTECDAS